MSKSKTTEEIRFDLASLPFPVAFLPKMADGKPDVEFGFWNELFASTQPDFQSVKNWVPQSDWAAFMDLLESMDFNETRIWQIQDSSMQCTCRATSIEAGWVVSFERGEFKLLNEHVFDTMSHNTMDGIASIQTLEIKHCNPRFAEILGKSDPTDLCGDSIIDWIHIRDW